MKDVDLRKLSAKRPWWEYLDDAWKRSCAFMFFVIIVVARCAVGGASHRTWQFVLALVDVAQVVAVLYVLYRVLISADPRLDKSKDDDAERSNRCVRLFMTYWESLWPVWFAFYGFHAGREFWVWAKSTENMPVAQVVAFWAPRHGVFNNFLHIFQGLSLLLLFLAMVRTRADDTRNPGWGTLIEPIRAVCFVLPIVQGFLIWYKPGLVVVVDLIAGLLVGLTAATCMAMFIGRLESRFLDVHTFELVALYAYAATQPLFPLLRIIRAHEPIDGLPRNLAIIVELLLKALACALKLGLYFVVVRQIESGRLTFYMRKVRVRGDEMESDWENFEAERLAPPQR